MSLTVFQTHEDDFAKIIRTESGRQVLIFCDNNEEGKPEVVQMTAVDGVTVRIGAAFNDDDSGYEKRDDYFAGIDEQRAGKFEHMALGAVSGATDAA